MTDKPKTDAKGDQLRAWRAPRIDELGDAADAKTNPVHDTLDHDGGPVGGACS